MDDNNNVSTISPYPLEKRPFEPSQFHCLYLFVSDRCVSVPSERSLYRFQKHCGRTPIFKVHTKISGIYQIENIIIRKHQHQHWVSVAHLLIMWIVNVANIFSLNRRNSIWICVFFSGSSTKRKTCCVWCNQKYSFQCVYASSSRICYVFYLL